MIRLTPKPSDIIKMEIQMHIPQLDVINFLQKKGYEVKAFTLVLPATEETLINTTNATVTTYYIITITNGTAIYTETIDVCVNPIPTVTSSLGPIGIWFGGDTVTYTPTSDVIGATFEWNRPTIECVEEPGTSGTGNISEYITASPRCNVIYNVRACYNG